MQLKDIMVKDVITITEEETIANAAKNMREANVGCLVVANHGSAQGIITDRDLAVRCVCEEHDTRRCQVANHMSSPAITADPSLDILDAAHMMTENQVNRLPVVEGDQIIGLVSFSDIAYAMDRAMHDLMAGMGAARAR